MINYNVATRNYEADNKLLDYLRDKLEGLEKYLPKSARDNVHTHIMLEEDPSGREANQCVCEIVMNVDGTTLVSREGTINMYAAIDVAEAKIKSQIQTLKDKQTDHHRARLFSRLLRRQNEESGPIDPKEVKEIEELSQN
jgi:ribosomal subunit interface protein